MPPHLLPIAHTASRAPNRVAHALVFLAPAQVVLFFSVMNEMEGFLFADNLKAKFGSDFNDTAIEALEEDEEFGESNLMHSINGELTLSHRMVASS